MKLCFPANNFTHPEWPVTVAEIKQ